MNLALLFPWRCSAPGWALRVARLFALSLPFGAFAAAPPADAAAASPEATLVIFNRDIATLRTSVLGISAADRVRRAKVRIDEQLADGGAHAVSLKPIAQGVLVQIDAAASFILTPDDTDPSQQETMDGVARKAAAALEEVVTATREARDRRSILRSGGWVALATLLLLVALWVCGRARSAVERRALRSISARVERLSPGGKAMLRMENVAAIVVRLMRITYWAVLLLLMYEWLSFVLRQFPYSRVWGERLNGFLLGAIERMLLGIVDAIPDLFTVLLIVLLARFAIGVLKGFFTRVRSGQIKVGWLEPDLAEPTRHLSSVAIWMFTLAMSYPYLPGSQTDAFKGVSVMVGLMISVGASSLVGQAASGLILIYSRVIRRGEYVRIAEHEGTVVDLGVFATRVRTGLGEELTLPNALILSNVTKNYSRAVKGPGFVLDTTVTIGYDTPWRQVEAMLVEAAQRTPGVLADPKPKVFQIALSDFYPEYRLVCQAIPSEPRPRAEVLTALHANIQDVFNTRGVQIMSPHYLGDPAQAKLVPVDQWFTPPAKPPAS